MEAEEMGDYQRAKRIHLERIAVKKDDPDRWFDYAVFLMGQGDADKALQCTTEALNIETKHRMSMLLRAIILDEQGDTETASAFLAALTAFYPYFTEAWVVFYFHFVKTEYTSGADVTLQFGLESMASDVAISLPDHMMDRDYMSWNFERDGEISIFMLAAVLLQKINVYQLAEVALAQDLVMNKETPGYLYMLAVHHYRQNSIDGALEHLEKAQSIKGQSYQTVSLSGHCLYNKEQIFEAISEYEYVLKTYERPEKVHLVSLRLGAEYVKAGEYEKAKCVYLTASRVCPTPLTWLGAGVALYRMGSHPSAEKALMEANSLDRYLAEVWGYLALVNLCLYRQLEFVQCYRQAKRTNLINPCIWEEIKLIRQHINYADPEPI